MELSEAFDLLEKEINDIGMVDRWGEPQDPAWGFALMERASEPESSNLMDGLRKGFFSPQEYYGHMLPLIFKFRIQYLAERTKRRVDKRISKVTEELEQKEKVAQ